MFGCEVCYLPDRLSIQFLFYNIDIFQANSPIEMKDETALEEEVNLENELFPSSAERSFHFFQLLQSFLRSPVIKSRSESRY